ncbi:unnamed protein product [Caenorhabditis sp. 36 PRJEB53466]|nr:unnamed protein product [Caenorhabditis sp. 36 PRJEB53466]
MISPAIVYEYCRVCGQLAHGKHFGAMTCRACAAFFRRAGVSNTIKPCKKDDNCVFLKNGWFNCKKCRLQKCWSVGMSAENFQFDRDTFSPKSKFKSAGTLVARNNHQIPESMGTFLGRSNLILFCAPQNMDLCSKNYIDVQFLVEKVAKVLERGAEYPIYARNSLQKLALGLQLIRGGSDKRRSTKIVTKIGKDETFALWQEDMLKVARWLTYFDEFRRLPPGLQMEMVKNIWKIWSRLENLATTVIGRRQQICNKEMIMVNLEDEQLLCNIKKVEIDLSWCSKYSVEQLKFFVDNDNEERLDELIQLMTDLNPSEIELSFMLSQLCFHYVGKRYQGQILEVADRFQDLIANDLHEYYVNELRMTQYSGRLAHIMKINNRIQQDIYRGRARADLARVFDVFCVEFSHPEMFVDI